MDAITHRSQLTATNRVSLLIKLIFIGLVTQIIYLVYVVAFPLISNTQAGGPAADLEMLMSDYRWFAPIYTAGILVLYYLFWQALKGVSEATSDSALHKGAEESGLNHDAGALTPSSTSFSLTTHSLKLVILAFGLLFGFTLVWLYPITANDIYRYVLRGRVWTVYGESPMLVPPDAFPDDPYIAFAGEFGDWVSGYGPLWEIVAQVPLRLGATDIVPATISLKLLVLFFYAVLAVLIGWFALPEKSSSLTALTFFAWNPLILMQGMGNGHNDMVFMTFMVAGIICWQRKLWWGAALALTLATLAKAPGALMLPLFGVALLRRQPTWSQRLAKGFGAVLIGLATAYLVYSALGPVLDTLRGVTDMLTTRRGFAVASELRMILREVFSRGAALPVDPASEGGIISYLESIPCNLSLTSPDASVAWPARIIGAIIPCNVAERMPRTTARYIFLVFYAWLLWQLWRNRLNLVTAGFLAYFSQLILGRTFRIWYPMWLIPLAALHLTPATFWRTALFSLTAELSIINYFVVWRWWLRDLPWERLGLLYPGSPYWPVMHTLTTPWLFGIPLLGPILINRRARKKQAEAGRLTSNAA